LVSKAVEIGGGTRGGGGGRDLETEEDVGGGEVAVDDFASLEVAQREENLKGDLSHLILFKSPMESLKSSR